MRAYDPILVIASEGIFLFLFSLMLYSCNTFHIFVSPGDVEKLGIEEIEIMTEIKITKTEYGPKPAGDVKFLDGVETKTKEMRFNKIFTNYLITKSESTDSKKWIGMKIPIITEVIKGNTAIVPNPPK